MGSIPVANASPVRRWRFPLRGVLFGAILFLAAAAAAGVALASVWPEDEKRPPVTWVDAGSAEDLVAGEPVRFPEEGFWLVKQESGEVLAFSQQDTHSGCTVPWRPDFQFMGQRGWFRDPCHGATYDLTGRCVAGPCPRDLDRFGVLVEHGRVRVDLQDLTCNGPLIPPFQCRAEP